MRVIITGATGLVGEGVLLLCLASPLVTKVLTISRKPFVRKRLKIKELIVNDFSDITLYCELQFCRLHFFTESVTVSPYDMYETFNKLILQRLEQGRFHGIGPGMQGGYRSINQSKAAPYPDGRSILNKVVTPFFVPPKTSF